MPLSASPLRSLTGARGSDGSNSVQLTFRKKVNVLIALPQGKLPPEATAELVIDSGLTLTGLPPYNIYGILYKKGRHTVSYYHPNGFVAGVVAAGQDLQRHHAHPAMPDTGRRSCLYHPVYGMGKPSTKISSGGTGKSADAS